MQAGKEILLKVVITALPFTSCHASSYPKKINAVDKKQKAFWWGQHNEEKKIYWVKWKTLKQNKGNEKIGFRDLHIFNKALLAKQAWRIIKNPNLSWVKLLKSIYFPNKDFLKTKPTNNSSWEWKSILKGREVIIKGYRWEVNNAENIKF